MVGMISLEQLNSAAGWVAVFISVAAAYYARQAVAESRRANEMFLLDRQHAIYDELEKLRHYMVLINDRAESSEIKKYRNIADRAGTCLPADVSVKVKQYYDACYAVADFRSRTAGSSAEVYEEISKLMYIAEHLWRALDEVFAYHLRQVAGVK